MVNHSGGEVVSQNVLVLVNRPHRPENNQASGTHCPRHGPTYELIVVRQWSDSGPAVVESDSPMTESDICSTLSDSRSDSPTAGAQNGS